jgi:hypothetical protein
MRALGLRGIGQTNTLPDRPEIQGMIRKVSHLITVEEATTEGKAKAGPKAEATEKDDVEEAQNEGP